MHTLQATLSPPRNASLLRTLVARDARYAIYFVPHRSSAWWQFGCNWLGRDGITGGHVRRSAYAPLEDAWLTHITAAPRRYGFHATLKAPMRLTSGYLARDVYAQATRLAKSLTPVTLPPLELTVIDNFVALALPPAAACQAAGMLAAQCVSGLDNLRAAATEAEIASRKAAGLTPRQTALLLQWGYPYVFEEYRLHFTLTRQLPRADQVRVIEALTSTVRALNAEPLVIDALSVCIQPERDAPFVLARQLGFDGSVEVFADE